MATEVEVVVVAKVTSSHGCRGMVPTEVASSTAEPVTKVEVTATEVVVKVLTTAAKVLAEGDGETAGRRMRPRCCFESHCNAVRLPRTGPVDRAAGRRRLRR